MQSLYDVPAPAKLNLFLHILGRRADGYHLLQSAFMLFDGDTSFGIAEFGLNLPDDKIACLFFKIKSASSLP